jgi:hypothetical protein
VAGSWRKLRNKELHNIYLRTVLLQRLYEDETDMRRMVETTDFKHILVITTEGETLGNLDIDGRIVLKHILKKYSARFWA